MLNPSTLQLGKIFWIYADITGDGANWQRARLRADQDEGVLMINYLDSDDGTFEDYWHPDEIDPDDLSDVAPVPEGRELSERELRAASNAAWNEAVKEAEFTERLAPLALALGLPSPSDAAEILKSIQQLKEQAAHAVMTAKEKQTDCTRLHAAKDCCLTALRIIARDARCSWAQAVAGEVVGLQLVGDSTKPAQAQTT